MLGDIPRLNLAVVKSDRGSLAISTRSRASGALWAPLALKSPGVVLGMVEGTKDMGTHERRRARGRCADAVALRGFSRLRPPPISRYRLSLRNLLNHEVISKSACACLAVCKRMLAVCKRIYTLRSLQAHACSLQAHACSLQAHACSLQAQSACTSLSVSTRKCATAWHGSTRG